jgi:peptide/nickel transport system permease protein
VLRTLRTALRNPLFITGLVLALFFTTVALFGRFAAPHDPLETNIGNALAPPSAAYPLGTDDLGRCILSRVITGCGTTLGSAALVEGVIIVTGLVIGSGAGFFGGVFDRLALTVIDILLSFPSIILALVIAALLGPGLPNLMAAMMAVYWVEPARIARSVAKTLREKEFVAASRLSGSGEWRVLFLHVLPHTAPHLAVFGALHIGSVITGISSLSFIGLGVRPPAPEWGAILNEARSYMQVNPLALLLTVTGIILSIGCFQLIGEALRDALNPRRL